MRIGLFLFPLNRFPLLEHSAGIAGVAGSKDMGMPPDQFIRDVADNFVNVEASSFTRDLRVHHHQQEQIAQFLAEMRVVLGVRSLRHFVSLFDYSSQQRFMGLFPVPWATAGG